MPTAYDESAGIEALYIHVPFCARKCAYCDFDSRACAAGSPALDAYAEGMRSCLGRLGSAGVLERVRTVYIGGGTPSLLGSRLAQLVDEARRWASPAELTCEANPDSFPPALAHALASAGATRVSLGVQSFCDRELAALGRLHTAEEAARAVACALDAELAASIDLMCGIPHQTVESWEETLSRACSLGVDHVSVYPLTVEEGTPLARRCEQDASLEPDEDFQAACMERARSRFIEVGLRPYEVASYARPGCACAHNIAYWTGANYLGLGRSAASMLDRGTYDALAGLLGLPLAGEGAARVRFTQAADALPGAGASSPSYEVEELDAREAAAEDLMLGMRMTAGVPHAFLDRARSVIPGALLDMALRKALAEGLARWEDGPTGSAAGAAGEAAPVLPTASSERRLVPTERGWLMGNELYGLLWGLAG